MGFTSGIAVLIFTTQIKDFFGLKMEKVPSEFVEKITALGEHFNTLDWPTLALAAGSLAIILLWPKSWQRRLPGSIVALVIGTVAVALLNIPVETIGSRFGGIPQSLPTPRLPALSWENIRQLVQPAMTIALLAAIESACAVVADGMVDDRHDSNQELMAQGLANIISPLFGGIAATSAIARTATTSRRSPVAEWSRADAGDCVGGSAPGEIHSPRHAERCAGQCGHSHGGVAQFWPFAQVAGQRRGGVPGRFRFNRRHRSYRSGRNWNGPGRVAVHQALLRNDPDHGGGRKHGNRRLASFAGGKGNSQRCHGLSHDGRILFGAADKLESALRRENKSQTS
jgi:hypothetical protein